MRTDTPIALIVFALVGGLFLQTGTADGAERKPTQDRRTRESKGDYAAYKLLKRGQELLEAGEEDRGTKMLQTVIEQYPKSPIRFQAYLSLGKYYLDAHKQAEAIDYLRNLRRLETGKKKLTGTEREQYLEGLYLTGLAHYQLRQYGAAFAALRRITTDFPDTVWANQAYYYIGMSHFAQSHWNKAIEALSVVGTFIDADSPTLAYAEAGHRFHVKISDGDLPVLDRMGKKVQVTVETTSGDKETLVCKPMSSQSDVFVASILTATGAVKTGDDKLQVIGGDKIVVTYMDDNTKEGKKDVLRKKTVEVVSTGGVTFTLGTYKSLAPAAYLGQPLFVRLWDLDLDKTAARDAATIRITSLHKPQEAEAEETGPPATVDLEKLLKEGQEEELVVRDEVKVTLGETGELPVRTGTFLGSVEVKRQAAGKPIDKTDQILVADIGDEIIATYVDDCHILGKSPVAITAKLVVAGEIDSAPRAAQDVVPDPLIKARKDLVEAEAYLELARIFKGMGLTDGAKGKAAEGLTRVESVIRTRTGVPTKLKQQAFQLKWELHRAEDDFNKAMGTCRTFNRLYPESPLVDQALMGIGEALLDQKEYAEAIKVLRQISRMPNSHAKAKAQFLIAQVVERTDEADKAIREYMLCAQKYPDSEYAGDSLAKVVDYHYKSRAYSTADDLLAQIFVDYQDEDFLDTMLLKWVLVAYQMGDYRKAHEKCQQLISEYPGSTQTAKAVQLLPRIEKMVQKSEKDTGEKGKSDKDKKDEK